MSEELEEFLNILVNKLICSGVSEDERLARMITLSMDEYDQISEGDEGDEPDW